MNKAEKEVLEFLENQQNWVDCDFETIVNIKGAISIIINQEALIDKLKADKLDLVRKHNVVKMADVQEELLSMRNALEEKQAEMDIIDTMYISKDKIRVKIKELEKPECDMRYDRYDIQEILQELLK